MTALDWAIQSPEGLQWPCTNFETAEAAQRTAPQMTILCRTPGGVWRIAEASAAPVSELARLRSERASTNAALSKAVEDCALLTKRVAELEAAASVQRRVGYEAAIEVMRSEKLPMSVGLLEAQLELDKLDGLMPTGGGAS